MSRYQRLDEQAVKATVDRLQSRIQAKFPDRNLGKVAGEVSSAIDELLIRPRSRWYGAVLVLSRVLIGVVLLATIYALVLLLVQAGADHDVPAAWEWASIIEATINDIVFAGVAIFFLWHVPHRLQRAHFLRSLHKLRSLAHVIDMHQLTKDPDRLSKGFRRTSQTLDVGINDVHQLWAYLDYCSELLSLVGKAAALFADRTDDNTVLATIEGIENLTTGMSRKIWQKISLIRDIPERDRQAALADDVK